MHYKAHAKVNIFLKIVGTRGNYHELLSRFVLVDGLFDTLWFEPKKSKEHFELVGNFDCVLEKNTIYKAYVALCQQGYAKELDYVMKYNALHVNKIIPTGSGLGGGSSDAATFLLAMNEHFDLSLSSSELIKIGSSVGADVAFFISKAKSANVSGIGEIVESFDEKALDIEVFTPPIACNTAKVYQTYREHFLQTIDKELADKMLSMKSTELLNSFKKESLNDLYLPALKCYPELQKYVKNGWFFSGSGSSFFRVKEKVHG